jgi:phosphoribosylformylglycinamidine cyclo-ligase
MKKTSYKDAGVNKEEGYRSISLIKDMVARTHNKNVLTGLGSFGSMYALDSYRKPVLVSGTDGVGTKLEVAFRVKKYDTVGIDAVAMCVNDVLCHGAQPLFFLDYIACGKLEAEVMAELVKGVTEGCLQSGAALIGGETAEMPGFYKEGDYDIAGFTVGVVEKDMLITGEDIRKGDVILALPSSGIHSNGFSLVRKLITDYQADFEGKPIWETLLKPTKIYVKPVLELIKRFDVHGLAHITGGGLIENIPRIIPKGLQAIIDKSKINIPSIFKYLQTQGVEENEMWNTFNMGVGFVLVVKAKDATGIIEYLNNLGEEVYAIGKIDVGRGISFI